MVQSHLSRLASPNTWQLKRKTNKWIARPMPGPHPLNNSLTLSFVLRDVLEYADTAKEIGKILYEGNVLVDGVARKEHRFPVGLMDIIEIPKLKEFYRVVYGTNGKINLVSMKKEESKFKLLKVIRKTIIHGGKLQITLHDGKTLLSDKFTGKVGDTIVYDLDKKTATKVISLEKGCLVYLIGGSHIGNFGKVKDVIKSKDLQSPKVVVEIDGNEYITLANYAFVLGKDKPEIHLEVKK